MQENFLSRNKSAKSAHMKRVAASAGLIVVGLIGLVFGVALSIAVGAVQIPFSVMWDAIFHFDPQANHHQIIRELRLPRAIAGALVGAGLAVAGAMMQGMTRNPLADSGLLGLNAGAGLALALCFALVPQWSYEWVMLCCFMGAGLGALLVFGIGSMARGGLTPLRLTLAGAAVSAFLIALTEGIALMFRIGQDLAFWYAGGIAGIQWQQVRLLWPWIAGGIVVALFLARSITLLSLGEEMAAGLGERIKWVRTTGIIVILVLAGASVSAVGMVGFIGLIVPHVARFLAGGDYRNIIPCSAVLGALLVVYADVGARMIHPPFETPIGALISLIGVPFFLYLARKEKRGL